MRTGFLILAIIAVVMSSCNRESEDFLWEYNGGAGAAYFISTHEADSGFISSGTKNGKAFLLSSTRTGSTKYSYTSVYEGSFRSALTDTAFTLAAGSTGNALLLTLLDAGGKMVWEKRVESTVAISEVFLFAAGEGEFVALCGSGPDDEAGLQSGLFMVTFDTSGTVITEQIRSEAGFFRISGAVYEPDGGFTIALTRWPESAKPRANAMRLNNLLETMWERELSNNPSYGAASLGICKTPDGGYLVSGRTELAYEGSILMNSFVSSLSQAGANIWKKYPENSNEGTALACMTDGLVYLLNRNCFIVNILNLSDGSEYQRIRTFNACDSYDTDARAEDFAINWAGNVIIAGTRGGNYYLALKPVSLE